MVEIGSYAIVGNGNSSSNDGGLSIYQFNPENAAMRLLETNFPDIKIRTQFLDREKSILYVAGDGMYADSRQEGGVVLAFHMNQKTGKAELLNQKKTLLPRPSYLWMDPGRGYLLVVHLLSDHFINYLVRNESGTYQSEIRYDDGGVVVFRLNGDGTLNAICDVGTIQKGQQNMVIHGVSHQHCIQTDPEGRIYVVCDEGLNQLISYHLNCEKGELKQKFVYQFREVVSPRCCVFHPEYPVFYCISRYSGEVWTFHCEWESGRMTCVGREPLLTQELADENPGVHARDIVIHPSGQFAFVSLASVDLIAVLEIGKNGLLCLKQNIFSGGAEPFGMCISPDGRFLLVTETVSGEVNSFSILSDGTLIPTGRRAKAGSPTNISIL